MLGNVKINEITILTRDNLNISVKSYIPESNKLLPVVLLLHMLGKDKSSWDRFITKLLDSQYAVFSIDMRGHGRSTKIKDGNEIVYTNMNESDWKKLPDDIDDVISLIQNERLIDKNRIGIVGASIGANTAIIAASKHPDKIKTIVALSPGLDYHDIVTLDAAEKLKKPILFAVSEEDNYSYKSCNELNKVVKMKHDLLIYKGAEHGTNLLNQSDDLESKVISWLYENLMDKK